jgi:hypothetical protein
MLWKRENLFPLPETKAGYLGLPAHSSSQYRLKSRMNSRNSCYNSTYHKYCVICYHTLRSAYVLTVKWHLQRHVREHFATDVARTLHYVLLSYMYTWYTVYLKKYYDGKKNLVILRDIRVCTIPEYGKVTFKKPSMCVCIQGVPGEMCHSSGMCSLCKSMPI